MTSYVLLSRYFVSSGYHSSWHAAQLASYDLELQKNMIDFFTKELILLSIMRVLHNTSTAFALNFCQYIEGGGSGYSLSMMNCS